jgi:hypothetical protein
MFAIGSGGRVINSDDFKYDDSEDPIVLRGILKHKIMKQCWTDGRDFYYMDTGYFGNEVNPKNRNGWKKYHRIVKNNLQHIDIVPRPDDRWLAHNRSIANWKKTGRKILVAPPGEKPSKFYGIDPIEWTNSVVRTIQQHTDRPIEVRTKPSGRLDRVQTNTFEQALADDVFAVVTYNSIAAVESVLHGIPVFTLAPNAAQPVASQDLTQIENPYYADTDKLYAWACHLAYGQFHVAELRNGTAMKILLNQ